VDTDRAEEKGFHQEILASYRPWSFAGYSSKTFTIRRYSHGSASSFCPHFLMLENFRFPKNCVKFRRAAEARLPEAADVPLV
jgi:hypothetical protein